MLISWCTIIMAPFILKHCIGIHTWFTLLLCLFLDFRVGPVYSAFTMRPKCLACCYLFFIWLKKYIALCGTKALLILFRDSIELCYFIKSPLVLLLNLPGQCTYLHNVCFKKTMTHLLLYTVVNVSLFFWNRRYHLN